MNIENLGFGKVIVRGKRRFVKLPVPLYKGVYKITVTVIRIPSMALYMRSEGADAYLDKLSKALNSQPGVPNFRVLKFVLESMFDTDLVSARPLEIPFYLTADKAGRICCLKITQGPGILALYTPNNLTKVLSILSGNSKKIIYEDEKTPWSMSIGVDT
jgi:hypothetical protein